VSCFFLQQNWYTQIGPGIKVPLYGLLGISFAFSLTFSFSELIALGPCDRCSQSLKENPIFATPKQVLALFATGLTMGAGFGLLFGLADVENDSPTHSKLKDNTLYSIPIGVAFGAIFGGVNQWYRARAQYIEVQPEPENEDHKY